MRRGWPQQRQTPDTWRQITPHEAKLCTYTYVSTYVHTYPNTHVTDDQVFAPVELISHHRRTGETSDIRSTWCTYVRTSAAPEINSANQDRIRQLRDTTYVFVVFSFIKAIQFCNPCPPGSLRKHNLGQLLARRRTPITLCDCFCRRRSHNLVRRLRSPNRRSGLPRNLRPHACHKPGRCRRRSRIRSIRSFRRSHQRRRPVM